MKKQKAKKCLFSKFRSENVTEIKMVGSEQTACAPPAGGAQSVKAVKFPWCKEHNSTGFHLGSWFLCFIFMFSDFFSNSTQNLDPLGFSLVERIKEKYANEM